MTATNLAISTDILWKVLEARGHDPAQVFRAAKIDPALAADPNARVPAMQVEQLTLRASELLGDPCIGLHAVQHWHPSHLGALGYAWLASSSLRTALQRLERYLKIVTAIMTVTLEQRTEGLAVVFKSRPGYRVLPGRGDFFVGLVLRMSRMNWGDTLAPVRVTLAHERYPCCDGYAGWFRCPIEFEAADNSMVFTTDAVDRSLPSGNPQLAHVLDQVIVRYIAALDRNDIVQRAKGVILDRLQTGRVVDDEVAQALHLSVRTLQRKLGESGTSFRELVDRTRRELAEAYIRDPTVSLSELAFMLGFSDASAFSRAYKRWTGRTPGAERTA